MNKLLNETSRNIILPNMDNINPEQKLFTASANKGGMMSALPNFVTVILADNSVIELNLNQIEAIKGAEEDKTRTIIMISGREHVVSREELDNLKDELIQTEWSEAEWLPGNREQSPLMEVLTTIKDALVVISENYGSE